LRTANVRGSVNKEFKKRTNPMEIPAAERPCYTLPAFFGLKMGLNWRLKSIGKVARNLTFIKEMAECNLIHNY
jgi:hypothetical protein